MAKKAKAKKAKAKKAKAQTAKAKTAKKRKPGGAAAKKVARRPKTSAASKTRARKTGSKTGSKPASTAKAAKTAKKKPGPTTATVVPAPPPGGAAEISAPRPANAPAVGSGTVSIRMHRGLLGDFFFIRHNAGGKVFKMLIDCGVLQCIGTAANKPSTSRGKERIIAAAADFMRACDGSLDLVVATHEHFDHLSGFIFANDTFKDLKIGKVWMAWTEDRSDKIANGYRNKKDKALTALAALVQNPALAATGEVENVVNLLQFYGGLKSLGGSAMAAAGSGNGNVLSGNASCEAVLEWLRRKAGPGNVSFLKPGEVVRWGVGDAFRAYVLGPPRDDEKLRQLNPSKGAAREVYLARNEEVETIHGLAAIHDGRTGELRPEEQPFVRVHWRPYEAGRSRKTRRAKSLKSDPIVRLYARSEEKYRRIDNEWLGSAENLALKIDGDVNNTSLAMALELADKRILLFPGDAQVGNCLSWGDQTYPADDSKDGPRLKIEELLARAIFYKVGHHASHNATLRERGLELMTDARLCAMIPLVEATAHEQKTKTAPNGWPMPYGDLYKRLNECTGGRILRGDGDTGKEKDQFKGSIFRLAYGDNFKPGDPLWAELALDL